LARQKVVISRHHLWAISAGYVAYASRVCGKIGQLDEVTAMTSDSFRGVDEAVRILKAVRDREGDDAALECAEEIICAIATVVAWEYGSDEAKRVLKLAAGAQYYVIKGARH
jgi:hypothetical protein